MGTLISLGVGRMEIDWGKNSFFRDHSALFKSEDVKMIPYFYVDNDGNIYTEEKEGLCRSLASMKGRLELLGYTLDEVQMMYNTLAAEYSKDPFNLDIPYDVFANLLKEIDIDRINTPELAKEYDENGYDLGEFVRRCIIPEKEIYDRLTKIYGEDYIFRNISLESFFENVDPYIILRLLAENPHCAELNVYWSYADVVEDEYVSRDEIIKGLENTSKILVITEGHSDSFVIRKAMNELYPDISDFFEFIETRDNYPFTGTSQLLNFCCGLMKIGILNNVIVLFDNDTEGNEKYNKLMKLPQLDNMLITKLPYHVAFEQMKTRGKNGEAIENVNGEAVAIECFLNFSSCEFEPVIQWADKYHVHGKRQGALLRKDEYVRAFKRANLCDGSYQISKLTFLVESILAQWKNRKSTDG